MGWSSTSIRTRTTAAAVLVVAVALLVGAAALLLVVRESLRDSAEAVAEARVEELVAQVGSGGVPTPPTNTSDEAGDADDADDADEDDEEPEDLVWQVVGADDRVVAQSQPLVRPLPDRDGTVALPGGDHDYVLVSERVRRDGGTWTVTVAVSLEDVDETTAALATPLLLGLPMLLLVLGGTTWVVVGRALRPVDRIRREVDQITGSELARRVPEPGTRDEVGRLATTMNRMLARLQDARDRQEQFVGDASHELRSPLSSLRQVAEVARTHPDAIGHDELSETVLEEAVRMQAIVDQLLLLTRVGDPRSGLGVTDVDLDDLALTEVRRTRRPDLVVGSTGVGPARVQGDAVALGQVVRNLVDNAARHAVARVEVSVAAVAGGAVLVVEDDGAGIPVADRQRVFDRFVRLDDARSRDAGGSGLGLAIVREVVAAHGGSVAVDDSPLGGARFTVHLPAAS